MTYWDSASLKHEFFNNLRLKFYLFPGQSFDMLFIPFAYANTCNLEGPAVQCCTTDKGASIVNFRCAIGGRIYDMYSTCRVGQAFNLGTRNRVSDWCYYLRPELKKKLLRNSLRVFDERIYKREPMSLYDTSRSYNKFLFSWLMW